MIRFYIIGVAILLVAIIANAAAMKLGLKTWYGFLGLMSDSGLSSFKFLNVLDYLWLFIGYPLVLGFGFWIGQKTYDIFF